MIRVNFQSDTTSRHRQRAKPRLEGTAGALPEYDKPGDRSSKTQEIYRPDFMGLVYSQTGQSETESKVH